MVHRPHPVFPESNYMFPMFPLHKHFGATHIYTVSTYTYTSLFPVAITYSVTTTGYGCNVRHSKTMCGVEQYIGRCRRHGLT